MSPRIERLLKQFDLLDLSGNFESHGIDDSLLAELTDENLRELGVDKIGVRKKLLAEIAAPSITDPGDSKIPTDPADPAVPAPSREPSLSVTLQQASSREPFVNTLGLPFVPLKANTLICIWPTRVRDFRSFCESTKADYPDCDFEQTPDHPAVNVSWDEAVAFCRWLTKRETGAKALPAGYVYDLPSDAEWSAAVGLSEYGLAGGSRSESTDVYPWGAGFPPPTGAGNYHPTLRVDDFPTTSPVGSFAANSLGMHDLGGNVWEWCLDKFEPDSDARILRGASCFNDDPEYLLSSFRDRNQPDGRRNNNGFRLVLKNQKAIDPWN